MHGMNRPLPERGRLGSLINKIAGQVSQLASCWSAGLLNHCTQKKKKKELTEQKHDTFLASV
jgi:hypothetical protein